MITGKENIVKWYDTSGKKYWFIYRFMKDANAENYVMHSLLEDNYSQEASRLDFLSALNILRGRYIIALCDKPNRSPKNDLKEEVEITAEHAVQMQPTVGAINGISEDEVNQKISDALLKYKTEQELKDLKQKVAELEKQNKILEKESGNALNKIAGIIGPYIPSLLGIQQPVAQVAGLGMQPAQAHETPESIELSEVENERLSNILGVFIQAAPGEWLDLLEKLAAKVQVNPAIINNLKMFL